MCFFVSFMPDTLWLVVGYFVLFSATKTHGWVQVFGRVLAIWIFIIATFIPVMSLYVTIADLCPVEAIMEKLQSG